VVALAHAAPDHSDNDDPEHSTSTAPATLAAAR
jgi:hypothetical protein